MIPVAQWDRYRKFVQLYVFLNLSFCAWFFVLLTQSNVGKAQHLYDLTLPVYFAYAFARVKLFQKRINITVRKGLKKSVAPAIVWLDHFFFGLTGVLLQSVSMRLDPDIVLHSFLMLLQVGFSFYAILPLLNYLKFRYELRQS